MSATRGIAIQYGDFAPEAKENFVPTASESEFDSLDQLQRYNSNMFRWGNPCELYQTVLDGSGIPLPTVLENVNTGLVSEQISNDDGTFTSPIVLELQSVGQYSSQGLTFGFDRFNNIYSSRVNIQWLRIIDGVSTELANKEFNPDSSFYFCQEQVNNYNKLVITFYSINMPKNRLKLQSIDYGYGTVFYGDEVRSAKQIQEQNPISTGIPIDSFDFVLDSKSGMDYSFQDKQPIKVSFDGKLISTNFVTRSTRKSKSIWNVQSEDYIGVLENRLYYGGMYTDAFAIDILEDIFDFAKVPYAIDSAFASVTVSGYIPYCTCREALMQVAFAIQAVVDTSQSDVINVILPHEEIDKTVTLDRVVQGQNFVDLEKITGVEVSMHTYTQIGESVNLYDEVKSGIGTDILVRFDEPIHSLQISNGTIVQSGTNYAVIDANAGCVLSGSRYAHDTQIKRKINPVILSSEKEKYFAIQNATLVSLGNIDNILEKCYSWFKRSKETNLKIIEGKHVVYGGSIKYGDAKYQAFKYGEVIPDIITYDEKVDIGNNINAETEYYGIVSGRVIKQTFNLNGNILIKDAVLR